MNQTGVIHSFSSYLKLLRPYQWIKNLLLFSPLFFSGNIVDQALLTAAIGVLVFCMVSGLGYVLNDWMDRYNDRIHPTKRFRPLSSGALSGKQAAAYSTVIILLLTAILLLYKFPLEFLAALGAYAFLTCAYSLYIKTIPILEIFTVAAGFVIRVMAGGAACGITISSWLYLTVFFIAMMISIAKRLNELNDLGTGEAVRHRKSQAAYSHNYLNSMLWACGSITLVVYALYAVEHGSLVIHSVVPASYGIFRFIYLTDQGRGSDPIRTLFSDRQLLLTTLIFLFFLTLVIYG